MIDGDISLDFDIYQKIKIEMQSSKKHSLDPPKIQYTIHKKGYKAASKK